MTNKDNVRQLADLLEHIAEEDVHGETTGFVSDKDAIRKLFTLTEEATPRNLLLRLTVIDSMYSTQMNRRYYGLDELAEALHTIQSESKKSLCDMFAEFAQQKDVRTFDYIDVHTHESTNLFSEKFGIGKDGTDKGLAISLISKYAYFVTQQRFPIYDSIACEMYPIIWEFCGFEGKPPKLKIHRKDNFGHSEVDGKATIVAYIEAIDRLIYLLGGRTNYDHLDRLLWFVGKVLRGNLSLVLPRENYEWCTKNLSNCKTDNGEFKFDIKKAPLKDLAFLKKNTVLYKFFELAEKLNEYKE